MGKRVLNQNSFIKIGQAAKTLGVSVDTLRRWERSGKITAIYTPGGTRLYPLKTFPPPLPTSSSLIQQVQVNSQKAEKIIKKEDLKSQTKPVIYLPIADEESNTLDDSGSILSPYHQIYFSTLKKISFISLSIFITGTFLATGLLVIFTLISPLRSKELSDSKIPFLSPLSSLSIQIASRLSPNYLTQAHTPDGGPERSRRDSSGVNKAAVLAESTTKHYLEINSDVFLGGDLVVGRTINGVNFEALEGGGIHISDILGTTSLNISGQGLTLDEELASGGAPTVEGLNLTSTKNQVTFSTGITGVLTWTPTSSSKTLTLPDITDTLITKTSTDTLSNKTINSSDSNTLSGSFTSITGLGTITTGTWNGTKMGTGYGGTGLTTYTKGDVLYTSASDTLSKLAVGSTGQALIVSSGVPAWSSLTGSSIVADSIDFTELADSMTLDADLAISASSSNYSLSIDSGTLYIDTANNRIGINDTTPSYSLDVTGDANITGATTLGSTLGVTGATILSGDTTVAPASGSTTALTVKASPTGSNDIFQIQNNAGTSTYFSINSSGQMSGAAFSLTDSSRAIIGTAIPGGWTNIASVAENDFTYRRVITIQNNDASNALPSNYQVSVTLNSVDSNQVYTNSQQSSPYKDFRLFYSTDGSTFTEIGRNISSFTSSSIVFTFQLSASIAASGSSSNYYLFYGNSTLSSTPSTYTGNTQLDSFDDASSWTSGDSAYVTSQETTIKQEGTGSLKAVAMVDKMGTLSITSQTQLSAGLKEHATLTTNIGGTDYLYVLGGNNGTSDQSTVYKSTISSANVGAFSTVSQGQLPQALSGHTTVSAGATVDGGTGADGTLDLSLGSSSGGCTGTGLSWNAGTSTCTIATDTKSTFNFTTINIPSGTTLTVSGLTAPTLNATGNITVAGAIQLSGLGYGGGGGGGAGTYEADAGNGGGASAGAGGGGGGSADSGYSGYCPTAGSGGTATGGGTSGSNGTGGCGPSGGTRVGGAGGRGQQLNNGGSGSTGYGPAGAGGGGGNYSGTGGNGPSGTGGDGGYLGSNANSDTSTDTSVQIGSGGGGGGGANGQGTRPLDGANGAVGEGSNGGGGGGRNGTHRSSYMNASSGGGGGGAGGEAIKLTSSTSITVSGSIKANGGAGGAGGNQNASIGGNGGGGAGGGILLYSATVDLTGATIQSKGNSLSGAGSTTNGGTIKVFYSSYIGNTLNTTNFPSGRVYSEALQPPGIYVIGGIDGSTAQSTVYKATLDASGNIGSFSTTSQNQLPQALYDHTSYATTISNTNYIYVLGGNNGTSDQSTVYKSTIDGSGNIGTFSTTSQGQLPQALSKHTSATLTISGTTYIYVLGGKNGSTTQSAVYKAIIDGSGNIGSFSTTSQGQLPQALQDLQAATTTVGSVYYIYAFGGNNGSADQSTIYRATIDSSGNIGSFSATGHDQLPQVLSGHTVTPITISSTPYYYTIGGINGSTAQSTVYKSTLTSDMTNFNITKTISSTDLSNKNDLQFKFYSSSTASTLMEAAFSEDGSTWQTTTFTASSANTWETKTWDISAIAAASRNGVTRLRFKINSAQTTEVTTYLDDLNGLMNASTISNTASNASAILGSANLTLNAQGTGIIRVNYADTTDANFPNLAGSGGMIVYNGSNTALFTVGSTGALTATGAISGLTGITSSGTITLSGLTASRAIFTDASSNLATTALSSVLSASISDEQGSGALVFATSPTLTTPVLGVATATSINKVAITAPTTSATLTIADGKTLTSSNTLTLAGTDSTTLTFQGTDTYIGRTTTDTLTNKTLTTPRFADLGYLADSSGNELLILDLNASAVNEITLANAATTVSPSLSATGGDTNISLTLNAKGTGSLIVGTTTANADKLALLPAAGGAGSFTGTFTSSDLTDNRTWTLPDSTGTVTVLGNTVTGTGSVVLATSPTLTSPALGVATATSINKVAITQPATSATLTIADGSSLVTSGAYAITLTSTGTTGVTLPTTGTLATLAGTETLTGKTLGATSLSGNLTASNTSVVSGSLVDAPGTGDCTSQTTGTTQAVLQTPTSVTSSHILYNSTRGKHSRVTSVATCTDGGALVYQIMTLTDSIGSQVATDSVVVYNPVADLGTSSAGFINNIYGINGKFVTSTATGGFDIAEEYPTADSSLEAGEIVVIANTFQKNTSDGGSVSEAKADSSEVRQSGLITRSSSSYQKSVLGVISTNPGITLGEEKDSAVSGIYWKKVALIGRVPVKVSTESGVIKAGDYLTSSSIPGVAMKATRPGQMIGKALEDYSGEATGKILVFVNPSFADPTDLLSNLTLDQNGNLVSSSSLAQANTSGVSPGPLREASSPEVNHLSVSTAGPSLLDLLSAQVASLSARLDVIESQRARLTQLEVSSSSWRESSTDRISNTDSIASPASGVASPSASLQNDVLGLTSPDLLLATDSAHLGEFSEATISGLLTSYEGIFQNSLKSLGETYLGNTTIAGNLSVDGTMSITGSSLSTLSTLYLQNGPLTELVDFFNGAITMNQQGQVKAKSISVDEIKVSNKSAGTGIIKAGQTKVIIYNTLIQPNSIILLTPETPLTQTMAVTSKTPTSSFTVKIAYPESMDITFNYLIVGISSGSEL